MRDRIRLRLQAAVIAIVTAISLGVPAMPPRSDGSPAWPNEPPGFAVISDWPFSTLTGGGWSKGQGGAKIVSDSSAPLSPPNIVEFYYPIGFPTGVGPDTLEIAFPPGTKEVFTGYWWKSSNPWQGDLSGVNKVTHTWGSFNGSDGIFSHQMFGQGEPYYSRITLSFPNTSNGHLVPSWGDDPGPRNLTGNGIRLTLGVWHRIEICAKTSTTSTSRDGVVRWWVDGAVGGDYTTVNYPSANGFFTVFQFAPTWGGNFSNPPVPGNYKMENDQFWFDHARISAGNGTGSGCLGLSPQSPFPQTPTNVTAG